MNIFVNPDQLIEIAKASRNVAISAPVNISPLAST